MDRDYLIFGSIPTELESGNRKSCRYYHYKNDICIMCPIFRDELVLFP